MGIEPNPRNVYVSRSKKTAHPGLPLAQGKPKHAPQHAASEPGDHGKGTLLHVRCPRWDQPQRGQPTTPTTPSVTTPKWAAITNRATQKALRSGFTVLARVASNRAPARAVCRAARAASCCEPCTGTRDTRTAGAGGDRELGDFPSHRRHVRGLPSNTQLSAFADQNLYSST